LSLSVIDVLHGCRLFCEVPPAGFQRLAAMAGLRRFSKGQLIFREKQECPGVYVVGSGLVRVFKTAPGGKEHVLHVVGPGNTFAEVAAIGRFDLPASAEAIEATVCALLPADRFRKALEEDHALCLGIVGGLTQWVRHLVGLMEDVVLRDAAGRLARFLLDAQPSGDGVIELPTLKRHLASHLNLSSETFSRTLRRLVDAGLIAELEGNRVRLLDRDGLRQVTLGAFPKI
jgi:CRP/FNR family transcriptional regulator